MKPPQNAAHFRFCRISRSALLAIVIGGSSGSAQTKVAPPAVKAPAAAPAKPAVTPRVMAPAAGTAPRIAGTSGAAPRVPGITGGANRSTGPGAPASAAHPAPRQPITTDHRVASPAHPTVERIHAEPRTVRSGSGSVNQVVRTSNGEVRMRAGGPAEVHVGHSMDIHHGLNGYRSVEVERADHSRIVAIRGGRGFVERPYQYRGRDFARRSYYYRGHVYEHYYGRYNYRGVYVNYYTPAYYYRPSFYGWAYSPWVAPAPYVWGWNASPWYGYYGPAFFAPYPVYPSASFWLTDYLISASLAEAYEVQVAQAQQLAMMQTLPVGGWGLTPDVKDLISAEVQRQIALENSEAQVAQTGAVDPASSSIQRMLTDNTPHVFVVGHDLDVLTSAGGECTVSQGDALQLAGQPPQGATAVSLIVLSSKGGIECPRSSSVSVQLGDLQEMQNHMRETIDQGLAELQSKQGRASLPAIPASAIGEPVKATLASTAPPPESNVGMDINQQMQASEVGENQVLAQAQINPQTAVQNAPASPMRPVQLELGMTTDDVTNAMGQPVTIAAGAANVVIYVYKDLKITFKDGKVSSYK